jgi:hypothetical protein
MFRDSTSGNSCFAGLLYAGSDLQWVTRESTGDNAGIRSSAGLGNPNSMVWLRLVRAERTFTAFYSVDGSTWMQLGDARQFTMCTTALAGFTVASGSSISTTSIAMQEAHSADRPSR